MTFSLGPPVYQCIQLDAIGTMTAKYYSVDNISPADIDGLTVKFPALTTSEAKDLARTVQDILDAEISPKKCKPITVDILDVEALAGLGQDVSSHAWIHSFQDVAGHDTGGM